MTTYETALNVWLSARTKYDAVRNDYRSKKCDDATYLAARNEFDIAQAIFDEAERAARDQNDRLVMAFVEGAKFWEYHSRQGTMWQSDQALCLNEARTRLEKGSLGVIPL